MCMYVERKHLSVSGEEVASLRERIAASDHDGRGKHSRVGARPYVSCEIGQGLPTADGQVWSYYMSQEDGRQLLVLNRRKGERIRISGTAEVVVLEIQEGRVRLGIGIPLGVPPERETISARLAGRFPTVNRQSR